MPLCGSAIGTMQNGAENLLQILWGIPAKQLLRNWNVLIHGFDAFRERNIHLV